MGQIDAIEQRGVRMKAGAAVSARPLKALVLILALALLLRVVMLVLAGIHAPLAGDELAYDQIAANLAAGRGFVQNNNPFSPGSSSMPGRRPSIRSRSACCTRSFLLRRW